MNDTNQPPEGSFIDRLKESPRTVSALIIILIVAAAIYAFSGNEATPPTGTVGETGQQAEEVTPQPEVTSETGKPSPSPSVMMKKNEVLPEARKTDRAYVEVAQRGEGVTHLARRAASQWLQENKADFEVTAAHKVYIEDYIRKNVGSKKGLALGEQQEIPFDVVKDAVAKAKDLSPNQLKNLQKYAQRANLT